MARRTGAATDDHRSASARRDRATEVPIVVIDSVEPDVDCGRFTAKGIVGDPMRVEVVMFAHGHEEIAGVLQVRGPGGSHWTEIALVPEGNDRWSATFCPDRLGRWSCTVEAWPDAFATWQTGYARRLLARNATRLDTRDGAVLVRDAAERAEGTDARSLARAAATLEEADLGPGALERLGSLMRHHADRRGATRLERARTVVVDRPRAACSAWYELFPRSTSPDPSRPGTLRDCIARVPYVAGLGFDVLYLPPIHPIGSTNRKGRDNATVAAPGDPGSPWAIGNAAGGHTAVDPALGTLADFTALRAAAERHGLEIALDLAFQCSPDHPWVASHPDWFAHRSDGSIRYAENPPKRYEDVLPLDFACADHERLWDACLDVVRTWIGRGVRIFRVDNPHTKPFDFWEWLLGAVEETDPDVIFLAEAFTRPAVMHRLAKLGFDQSYTYFTWRNTKQELEEYVTELTNGEGRHYYRPNAWPNTPDILHETLQHGGPAAFVSRFVLAAGLFANYGIYGPAFELGEHRAREAGSEEYLHSEKYEVRHWDLDDPRSLRGLVATVNAIRRDHPALQRDHNLVFHGIDNEQLICWSKRSDDRSDVVLCIVNLDPRNVQSGWTDLHLAELGIDSARTYSVVDLLDGRSYRWEGERNYVSLDPSAMPAHVFAVSARDEPSR